MSNEILEIARTTVGLAKKSGAQDAMVSAGRWREVETQWRDGKLEKISDAISKNVSIQLYVDGRYGSMSTSDLRLTALETFVDDAVALVRAIAKDPHRKLADRARFSGQTTRDLELHDPKIGELTADARLQMTKALEEAARTARGAEHIVSVTTSVNDSESESAKVTTNGFEGTYRGTSINASAEVSVKDDDGRRPEDWASGAARHLGDLLDPKAIGREATERAVQRLGAKKIASGTTKLIVEARSARNLLRHLIGPLSGWALQQKESFLEGKLDKEIASKLLTLSDDATLVRGLASRPYDGEGMAARPWKMIDKGVLRTYFVDVYYGSKLGIAPTTSGTSNLIVASGDKSLDALIRDVKDGILVTGFLGGNSNSTTGVFSLGITGFRIAGGEKKEPIGEMNISGKHLDFWKHLVAVGNDPYLASSTRSPSLVFEGVSVAGK